MDRFMDWKRRGVSCSLFRDDDDVGLGIVSLLD